MNEPDYLKNATPVPQNQRAAWFKNIAPAYAGIILWFVFWQDIVKTGTLGGGLINGIALPVISLVVAGLVAYALFYLPSALFGMKTGFGLAIVGNSLFGKLGGVFMPGLFMGILQFGWLGVNIYFASLLICETLTFIPLWLMIVIEGVLAAFVAFKGIKYVAGISTWLPLIPLVVLILMLAKTLPTVCDFTPEVFEKFASTSAPALSGFGIFSFVMTYVIGFFATAGAAGADFGTSARGKKDVHLGGFFGICLSIILTGTAAILIIAGAYANPEILAKLSENQMCATQLLSAVLGDNLGKTCMFLLAVSAFPSACFACLIAANSFKTLLPKVNATLSVSCGAAAAILLALTGVAGKAAAVFGFIGASFGPICGAIMAEYFLRKGEWKSSDVAYNPAGWIAWAIGFIVGVANNFGVNIPLAPVVAFIVGFVVYIIAAKIFRSANK